MKSVSIGETRLPLRLLDQLPPFPAVRRPSAESWEYMLHGGVRLLTCPDACTQEKPASGVEPGPLVTQNSPLKPSRTATMKNSHQEKNPRLIER